jgi:hypothetical protein
MMFAARARSIVPLTPPAVEGYAFTQSGYVANGGTAVIAMPSGIQAGELLLCLCGAGATVISVSAGGFTKMPLSWSGGGQTFEFSVFYKIATGGDTLTVLNTGSGTGISAQTLRVSNANTIHAVTTYGSDSTANFPVCAAPHVGKSYLYFVAVSFNANYAISTAPSGYSDILTPPADGYGHGTSSARKSSIAASDDPGSMTLSGSASYEGATLVVYQV